MAIWTAIHGLADGEEVTESVLNRPLFELKERTEYLYNLLNSLVGAGQFESVRIPDLPVETEGPLAPGLKDIVYLNPESHKLEKASAELSTFSSIFSSSDIKSLAIGILTSVTDGMGTVAVFGKVLLEDTIGAWDTADMLEQNEVFRAGPYYLSSIEPGKLTANPKGPAIYIGQFLSQVANPAILEYAILAPQYKDVAEAHVHRAIVLATQPAGSQEYTADPITGTHVVYGFNPTSADDTYDGTHTGADAAAILTDSAASFVVDNLIGLTLYNVTKGTSSTITANTANTITTTVGLDWDNTNQYKISVRNRLVVRGPFLGALPVQYTLTLAGLDVATPPTTGVTGFESVYLHWSSSDPNEEDGYVRVRSYEVPLSIGDKGVVAILENVSTIWDAVEGCGESRRQWVIDIPDQTMGWLANKQRGYFTSNYISTDQGYSIVVFDGPHTTTDNRVLDDITVKSARLYRIVYGANVPVDGNVIVMGDTTFEFDDNDILTSPDNIAVTIVTGDADGSFEEFVRVMNEVGVTGGTATINTDDTHVMLGVADADTASTTLSAPITFTEVLTPGVWSIGGTNGFLVYDKNYKALIPTNSYWSSVAFWTPVTLTNGLQIMVIPYDAEGTAAVGTDVTNGDYWTKGIIDEAPGAHFVYSVAMDATLNESYPPVPFNCGMLVLNGISLENDELFNLGQTYRFGNNGIYWYSNRYPRVPWPQDWVSVLQSGSPEYAQYMVYHTVRMAIGNSSVVTSLQPAPDSAIKLYKCGTSEPASVGDLAIDVDLQLAEVDTSLEGYNVYKAIVGNRLVKGPIVSKIEAGPGIEITSPPGVPNGRGRVRIGLSTGTGLGGDFEQVALQNAKQEMIGLYPYIKLLGWNSSGSNIETGFTSRFKVPLGIEGNYKILIYFTLFGETDIPTPEGITPSLKYAGLEFYYSILHDYMTPSLLNPYDNLVDDLITPSGVRNIEVPMGKIDVGSDYIYKAYDPVIIHNDPNITDAARRITKTLGDPIPTVLDIQRGVVIDPSQAYVTAGSLVAIQVKRAGVGTPANEYTGALGFINMRWRLL